MTDSSSTSAWRLADIALGAAAWASPPVRLAAGAVRSTARTAWRTADRVVPARWAPSTLAAAAEERGRSIRLARTERAAAALAHRADALVPVLAAETISRLEPHELIDLAAHRIDDDRLRRQLDVLVPFATEAIASRIEPVTLIEANLRPEQVEKLLDLYLATVTEAVLARLDLTGIVRSQVDLTGLTRDVLVDLNLVEIVEMVIAELDLADIAQGVIDDIDLPSIIRESSSGVAADVVGSTRETAASADDAVSAFFGRLRGGGGARE